MTDEPQLRSDRDREFAAFFREHSGRLLHLAELLTGDPQRAEDLLQVALIRAYRQWPKISRENPCAYVRQILLNAQRDWWRRPASHERPVESLKDAMVPTPRAPDLADAHAARDAMLRALRGLTKRERAALVLRYYEDLPEAAIAASLGVSAGTVKSTLSRALSKLRQAPDLSSFTSMSHLPTELIA